ncbi:hypothetical protein E1J25_13780 [Xanthomonas hortorum pv. taraxaci]|nr:hypothetical protein [Xanthomonas hortorum pv. taraxaci]
MRGAASSVGTRRESVRGGSVAASMPPHGPNTGYDTTPPLFTAADWQAMPSLFPAATDNIRRCLHAYRRGTLRGMDAA